jgi:SiaC family regulatory phosphoprotein
MMDTFFKAATDDTPEILFNPHEGKYLIKGISIPEDAPSFYKPSLEWIHGLHASTEKNIDLDIFLNYYNTGSLKSLVDILKAFVKLKKDYEKNLKINWYYEAYDDDMKDKGKELSEIVDYTFNLKEEEA